MKRLNRIMLRLNCVLTPTMFTTTFTGPGWGLFFPYIHESCNLKPFPFFAESKKVHKKSITKAEGLIRPWNHHV